MIKNFTTGKTKFVRYRIISPDGRFNSDWKEGGIDLKTIMFEAKKYPKEMIIEIFDSVKEKNLW